MTKELRASIDIGSNSVLLLIAEVGAATVNELVSRSEITSLGRDLDKNQAFHEESMKATFEALKSYAEDCDRFGIPRESIIVTATEASRVAQNAVSFFNEIKTQLGVQVEVITPQAEAYFSTKGIMFNSKFSADVVIIMDVGGASTELIKVNTKNYEIIESISMPVGSVRSTQWLDDQLFVQNLQKVFLDYRNQLDRFQTPELYCVAGTITSLGNMYLQRQDFVESAVHNLVVKVEDMDTLFKRYSDYTPDKFLDSFPFLQKRSKSIRGGLHLVYHLMHRLFVKEFTVSTYGLRYGTLLEGRVAKEYLYGK
jgi:exopolyphosphatase/guanosine-5'-triphosphate,3'-diphosphate pyrophosphatase